MFGYLKRRNFRRELERALADGVLTDDEVQYLQERSDELGIEQEFVNQILQKHFDNRVASIKDKAAKTRRFSPDDEAEMRRIAQDLRMHLNIGPELKILRTIWEWKNRYPIHPEPIAVPILLDRSEACYFYTVTK